MRHSQTTALCAAAALLAACQSTTLSQYAQDGVQHTEPVQFNDQRYEVSFVYSGALTGFDVLVSRPSRPLSDGTGDRDTSIQVATSAISHYACAQGQRAHVIDGSAVYASSSIWALQAKCRS